MIIALLALAFAMIVGGLLATFFGWDIVLVERGWTMVIAGSISAASGALLLGITAAVSKLASIQAELERLQADLETELANVPPQASTDLSLAALSGGLLDSRASGEKGAKELDEKQVVLSSVTDEDRPGSRVEAEESAAHPDAVEPGGSLLSFPSRASAETAPFRDEDEPEIKVPDFLLAERHQDTHVEDRISDADSSLYASEEPESKQLEEERGVDADRNDIREPMAERTSEPEHEPVIEQDISLQASASEESTSEESVSEEPRPATVVGTYNSGDNKYVMFSDGSIEAQTPGGVFRFQSLEELKEFIASGGEGGSSSST